MVHLYIHHRRFCAAGWLSKGPKYQLCLNIMKQRRRLYKFFTRCIMVNSALKYPLFASEMKRLIGRPFSDPCVQADMKNMTCSVVNVSGQPRVQVNHKGKELSLTPEAVSLSFESLRPYSRSEEGTPASNLT